MKDQPEKQLFKEMGPLVFMLKVNDGKVLIHVDYSQSNITPHTPIRNIHLGRLLFLTYSPFSLPLGPNSEMGLGHDSLLQVSTAIESGLNLASSSSKNNEYLKAAVETLNYVIKAMKPRYEGPLAPIAHEPEVKVSNKFLTYDFLPQVQFTYSDTSWAKGMYVERWYHPRNIWKPEVLCALPDERILYSVQAINKIGHITRPGIPVHPNVTTIMTNANTYTLLVHKHNSFGALVGYEAVLQLNIKVPERGFGVLGGMTVPYARVRITVERLPNFMTEVLQRFTGYWRKKTSVLSVLISVFLLLIIFRILRHWRHFKNAETSLKGVSSEWSYTYRRSMSISPEWSSMDSRSISFSPV